MAGPRAPRAWIRWLEFPADREPPPPVKPMEPRTGKDGIERSGDYFRKSLGMPTAPAQDEDYGVTWERWPPA